MEKQRFRPIVNSALRFWRYFLPVLLLPLFFIGGWYATPARHRTLTVSAGGFGLCAISPDAKFLATADEPKPRELAGPIRVWDLETGQECLILAEDWKHVHDIAFSPNGRLLVAKSGDDIHLRLWDIGSGTQLADFNLDSRFLDETHCRFSPDGKFLVIQSRGNKPGSAELIKFWEIEAKQVRTTVEAAFQETALSADGKRMAAAFRNDIRKIERIVVWKLEETPNLLSVLKEYSVNGDYVAISPDLRTFALVDYRIGKDQRAIVSLYDLATGEMQAATRYPDAQLFLRSFSFSRDSRMLISESESEGRPHGVRRKMTFWQVSSGLQQANTYQSISAISPDSRWIVTHLASPPDLLESETGKKRCSLAAAGGRDLISKAPLGKRTEYQPVVFSPDSTTLAIEEYSYRTKPLPFIGRTNDLKQLAADTMISVTRLWELETAKEIGSFAECKQILYLPNSRGVVTLHENGTINIWDCPPSKSFRRVALVGFSSWFLALVVGYVCARIRKPRKLIETDSTPGNRDGTADSVGKRTSDQ